MDCTNVIECSDIYSKRSGSLWQYYRDEPTLSNAGSIVDFPNNNNNNNIIIIIIIMVTIIVFCSNLKKK